MLNNQTISKLIQMRLPAMADALAQQLQSANYAELSFEDRLGMLVDREWSSRQDRKVTRLVKQAGLRFPTACTEDIDWDPKRKLDRPLLLSLASGNWIDRHLNIIIEGKTGVGKSWISSALGNSACRHGISVFSIRLPKLLTQLTLARGDGSYSQVMSKLKKHPVLILDDWLINPLDANQCRELLEVLEERYDRSSTIFASQLPVEDWYRQIGEPTLADAILDRCVHNAYHIHIDGDTKRKDRLQR
jgi:DNA replication protein DnaC